MTLFFDLFLLVDLLSDLVRSTFISLNFLEYLLDVVIYGLVKHFVILDKKSLKRINDTMMFAVTSKDKIEVCKVVRFSHSKKRLWCVKFLFPITCNVRLWCVK